MGKKTRSKKEKWEVITEEKNVVGRKSNIGESKNHEIEAKRERQESRE